MIRTWVKVVAVVTDNWLYLRSVWKVELVGLGGGTNRDLREKGSIRSFELKNIKLIFCLYRFYKILCIILFWFLQLHNGIDIIIPFTDKEDSKESSRWAIVDPVINPQLRPEPNSTILVQDFFVLIALFPQYEFEEYKRGLWWKLSESWCSCHVLSHYKNPSQTHHQEIKANNLEPRIIALNDVYSYLHKLSNP